MFGAQGTTYDRLRGLPARLSSRLRRSSPRDVLLAKLPKNGAGAEIGSWKGDFAARILTRTKPARLFLIDPWEFRSEEEYEHAMYGGHAPDGQREMDAIYRSVMDRFAAEVERGQVVVRRSRSADAAADFPDESLDFVYIDGDHTYAAVKADLDAYYRTVKSGGFVTGDDYGTPGWWDNGVTRAVDEFVASHRCGPPEVVGRQFLIRKP
jgi:Methyltransferase domain